MVMVRDEKKDYKSRRLSKLNLNVFSGENVLENEEFLSIIKRNKMKRPNVDLFINVKTKTGIFWGTLKEFSKIGISVFVFNRNETNTFQQEEIIAFVIIENTIGNLHYLLEETLKKIGDVGQLLEKIYEVNIDFINS